MCNFWTSIDIALSVWDGVNHTRLWLLHTGESKKEEKYRRKKNGILLGAQTPMKIFLFLFLGDRVLYVFIVRKMFMVGGDDWEGRDIEKSENKIENLYPEQKNHERTYFDPIYKQK